MQRNKKAFTLIELLVVISIIAVLMSILMPALAKVRSSAKRVFCGTRQKDIGTAFSLYSVENNNRLPYSVEHEYDITGNPDDTDYGRWMTKLIPYYPAAKDYFEGETITSKGIYIDIFRCPEQEKKFDRFRAAGTYGYNVYFTGTNDNRHWWKKFVQVKNGSRLPLLGCLDGTPSGIAGDTDIDSEYRGGLHMDPIGPSYHAFKYGFFNGKANPATIQKARLSGPAPNHEGQCNFLFADFHVESRKICDEDAWPWFGDFDGSAFNPAKGGR
jgi:prepilin-type N-terminal cleavage/methylation domain-containing protein/prepilin-type processing-associated H-X9-DG protein